MSEQDSRPFDPDDHKSNRPPPSENATTTHSVGYVSETSQTELAIETIEQGLIALYVRDKIEAPPPEKLREMAEDRLKSSIEHGSDDHIGTAAPK